MALMDDAVAAVVAAAGWKAPERGTDGSYRFELEGDLDFALFSPDGRVCLMRGVVRSLPDEGQERDTVLSEAARRQVGVCRTRASILSLEHAGQSLLSGESGGDKLVLTRQSRMEAGDFRRLQRDVQAFLNDFAWWKAACGASQEESGASSFFSMQSMFTGGRF